MSTNAEFVGDDNMNSSSSMKTLPDMVKDITFFFIKHHYDKILKESKMLEESGCFAIVVEHIPGEIASRLKKHLTIPVIGIGAGSDCDGQVRVTADILGLSNEQPPFAKPLFSGKELCIDALKKWIESTNLNQEIPTTKTSESKSDSPPAELEGAFQTKAAYLLKAPKAAK